MLGRAGMRWDGPNGPQEGCLGAGMLVGTQTYTADQVKQDMMYMNVCAQETGPWGTSIRRRVTSLSVSRL